MRPSSPRTAQASRPLAAVPRLALLGLALALPDRPRRLAGARRSGCDGRARHRWQSGARKRHRLDRDRSAPGHGNGDRAGSRILVRRPRREQLLARRRGRDPGRVAAP